MIFISLGTTEIPFERLIKSCLDVLNNSKEKIYIQHGKTKISYRKNSIVYQSFISNTEMINKLKKARIVISAAGEATIFQILQYASNKPILFPRLQKYNEQVDDQQLHIAKYFEKKNKAFCVINSEQLSTVVNKINKKSEKNTFREEKVNEKIISKLIEFTEQI